MSHASQCVGGDDLERGVMRRRRYSAAPILARAVACALLAAVLAGMAAGATAQTAPNVVMAPHSASRVKISEPPAATPITAAAIARTLPTGAAARSRLVKTLSLTCTPPPAPNEIVELARALGWNPDLIYEYVHNNIDTIPIYDSLKGPLGTLIDGAGTPIDQAELMYALLQQSCYSPQYEIGTIYLTVAQLTNWLGTDNNLYSIGYVLTNNGFPGSATTCSYSAGSPVVCLYGSGTTVTAADIPWVWVSVPIPNGGTSYQFDPASKTFQGGYGYNTRSNGVANLGSTALQYTQSNFLSDAESGATGIGTPSVSGINRANVRRDTTTYANNLINYIKTNKPTATTIDIIGGSTVSLLPYYTPPATGPTKWGQTVLCNIEISGTCYPNAQKITPTTLANLNVFRTTLTLTLGWNDSNGVFTSLASPVTFNSSDIYGHRLSIMFDPSTNVPRLLLDGITQTTASGTVPAPQLTARVSIDHPHIPCASVSVTQTATGNTTSGQKIITNISSPSSCPQPGMSISGTGIPAGSTIIAADPVAEQITISNAATATNSGVTLTITSPPTDNVRVTPPTAGVGAVFVIGTGWGGTGRGMIEKHRKLLRQNAAAQNPPNPSAEPVLGEGLAMIGYTWLAEWTLLQQRVTELTGVTTTYPHAVGIIGMKPVGSSSGPFVDLPVNILTTVQRTNHPQSTAPTPAETAAFFVDTGMSSVLESGSIEQTQPNATAASTVKLLDLWSQSGAIFDINNPEISGDDCTYYKNNIRPNMMSYGGADQARIDSLVGYDAGTKTCSGSSTTRVIAPSNGALSIGSWTGTGYIQVLYDPTRTIVTGVGNIITGGLSGGEPASPVPPAAVYANQAGSQSGSQSVPPSQSAPSVASPTNTNLTAAGGGSSLVQQNGGDPVNLVTGSYVYNHQDLSVGSGPYPDTLPFIRYFDSSLAQSGRNSSLLGNGWMHNYDMTALPDSDGFEGMGDNSPISGAAAIATLYVLQDILNLQTSTAKPTERIIIASQAEVWLMQQLTNNIVSVVRPGTIERFALLPNGTYNPPLGAPTLLTGSSSAGYRYQSGAGVTLTFNPASGSGAAPGKITGWSNAAGASVDFSYDTLGQLQSICEPSCASPARQLNLSYTGNQLISVNDNTGSSPRTVRYSYDSDNDMTGVTDPLGNLTSFAYAGVGQLARIYYPANPTNAFVSMTYDTLGRPNQQADAGGNLTTLKIAGTRAETDDPGGTARVSYFNPVGQTLATIDGLGSATINSGAGNLTSYAYDGLGRLSTVTLPQLGSQTYAYDSLSNPLTITSNPQPSSGLTPLVRSFTYVRPVASLSNFEEVQTATGPRGLVTRYGYDQSGNATQIVADSGGAGHFNATGLFTYDTQGRILTAIDPLGTLTQYTYDNLGNLTQLVRDAGVGRLNQTTRMGYDGVGNVATSTNPNGNVTTNAWDANRRLVTVTTPPAPLVLTTALTYDPNGNLLQSRQSSGGQVLRTTSATYTRADKIATSTDAKANVTRYAYDTDDRLSRITDPIGNETVFGYDALSRPDAVSNPAIQANPLTQRAYTPDGLPASLTIARSNSVADMTSYTYDGFDRLAATAFPDASAESLSYDANGNILTRQTRKGDTIAFAYDTLNRVCTKTYATTSVACGGSSSNYLASYGWDLAGRLIAVGDNSAAVTKPAASASYVASTTYDAMNRPLQVGWSPAAAQTAPAASGTTFGFSYDATNRRIGATATDKSWWSYPTTAGTVPYTANNLNQYSAVGSVSPTYDGNGNLGYDGTFTYGYDVESRLVSVKQGANTVATYAYDAQGRRKSKTVGSTTTMFMTDADNREVLEYDGTSGALQRWYAFGQGPDAVLGQMNVAAGTRETMIPDIQGSIVGTLDSGTGALTKTGYQPFGENPTLTSGTYRWTGRRFDPETAGSASQPSGLYYFRARMNSPTWGRFLQPDPIGYAGGPNLYAYVGNDPLNNIDPQGLFTLQVGVAGGGTILGFLVPQGGLGFVIDTHGNIGTYAYSGVGAGIGVQAGVGGSVQFSNAQTIYDLSGPFANTSLHGGAGVGGSVDFFTGTSRNGQNQVTGGGITFGASAGASASLTTTGTQVCGSQGCVGSPLPLVNVVTPTAAATASPQNISPTVTSTPIITSTTGGQAPPK